MQKGFGRIWSFVKELYAEWQADGCFQLAAALSYYTVFSIAPMVTIMINVTSYFLGEEAVTGELYDQLSGLLGPEGAESIQTMVQNSHRQQKGLLATVIGTATLLVSATGAFAALQDALNKIYQVKVDPTGGVWVVVFNRLLAFGMLLCIGLLLASSLLLEVAFSALRDFLHVLLADYAVYLLAVLQRLVSFGISTLLFALLFKFLPDVSIPWRRVWPGALLTAALFTVGRTLLGYYLGQSNLASTYGAAASVVLIMLWVNYSAWILFIGAEYIDVYVKRRGEVIEPAYYAKKFRYSSKREKPEKTDS
jgi:membrane protein